MTKTLKTLCALVLFSVLPSCENSTSHPNPRKSNRSFSNIDKNTRHKKSYKTQNYAAKSHPSSASFSRFDLNNYGEKSDDHSAVLNQNVPTSGIFKIGNPYEIEGVSYFPQNFDEFEETGMASWYGPDFHGKPTANGEIYDSSTMTAAHPTLPLPSMVKVTNLRNGKSAIVRVNDRGPFSKKRIIDVSEKAADELGFKGQGTTQVHIQLLRNETDEMLARLNLKN